MDGRFQLHICRDRNHQNVRRHGAIEDREWAPQALCQITLRCNRAALTPHTCSSAFMSFGTTRRPFAARHSDVQTPEFISPAALVQHLLAPVRQGLRTHWLAGCLGVKHSGR